MSIELFEKIHSVESPMFITLQTTFKQGKPVIGDACVNKLDSRIISGNGYEYLGKATKLFFDIDGSGEALMNKTFEFKAHLDSLLETGKRKFVYCYSLPEDMIEASRRKDYRKLSFHVIFEDKAIQRVVTDASGENTLWQFNSSMEEDTLKWLLGPFYDELRGCVDESVYDRNRKFRLPLYFDDDKPVSLRLCDETVDLTRFAVNLPPGYYKVMYPRLENESQEEIDLEYNEEKRESNTDDMDKIKAMLDLIKKERFQNRSEWLRLLSLLHGNGFSEDLFVKISQESGYSKFKRSECIAAWENCKDNKVCRFKTLQRWMTEDGIDWKSIFCQKTDNFIKEMLRRVHMEGGMNEHIGAEALASVFKDELYYIPSTKSWYFFQESSGWEKVEAVMLLHPIMKNIGEAFCQWITRRTKPSDTDDKEFKKETDFLKGVAKVVMKAKFCENVLKVACGRPEFKRQDILDKFDDKPHLFAFSNMKAYNLLTGQVVDIEKDDYVLTTCGYPLPEEIKEDEKLVDAYIADIQPSETRESFISVQYQSCYGRNKNQQFFCHTGIGSNSKSFTTEEVCVPVFGNYAAKLPIDQWTGDSNGVDRANSSLSMMRGKRFVYSSEPSADIGKNNPTTLKVNRIKEFTGDKEIMVRGLHENASMMKICFTPHILANVVPKLSKNDGGISRRMAVVPYPYTFIQDYDEKTAEDHHRPQKQETVELVKTQRFRNAYLWKLLRSWTKNQGKYISSHAAQEETAEYMAEQNILSNWLSFYELSDKPTKVSDLLKDYNDWAVSADAESLRIKKFTENIRLAFIPNADGTMVKIPFIKDDSHGHKVKLQKISK